MFVSKKLRQENIAEYILYMWQTEDLIRAYGCQLTRIRREYISRFDYTDEEKEELADWYGNLIRMMNEEGCREKGHLQINKATMMMLTDLHNRLTASTKFPFYTAAYYKALPFIVELRNKGASKEESEIETCFDALYGVMLLRMQKKEVSRDTQTAIKAITTLVGMLNDYYFQEKSGELDIEN